MHLTIINYSQYDGYFPLSISEEICRTIVVLLLVNNKIQTNKVIFCP